MPLANKRRKDTAFAGEGESLGLRQLGLTVYRNGKKLRTFFPQEKVTIGRDDENDISYFDWGGKEGFVLLERTGANRYLLNLNDQMSGKVSYMGVEVDFRTLIVQGLLPRKDSAFQFEIVEGKAGELNVGELTFEFGYLSPPAFVPPVIDKIRPKRRSFTSTLDDEDRNFTYLLLGCLVLSAFFLIFAFIVGPKDNLLKIVDMPDVIAELVNVDDLEASMMGSEEGTGEGTGGGGGGGGGVNLTGGGDGTNVYSTGLLGILTTEGPSGGPSVVDILGGGGGASDIDAVLGGLGGLTTSGFGGGLGEGGGGLGLGGFGGSGGMDLAALLSSGGGGFDSSELDMAGTVTLTGPSSVSGTAVGESGRSSSAISGVISAHMSGLQSAYNAQLKKNPNLQGKIVVTFTINAQGTVTNAYVSSSSMNSPEMESQIISRIYGWKFPAVSGGEVTVVYPFIFVKT